MIKSLSIQNYAIIEAVQLDFPSGLTIITGETGAGKSIILGALGLIMGKRADISQFYNNEKKCVIEGVFDIKNYDLAAFFEQNELDYEEELILRREIRPTGKSRAFINDTPVTIKLLDKLSHSLIDLHQQFDTLDIHDVSFQLRMVDALADNQVSLIEYQKEFFAYQKNKRQLKQWLAQQQAAKQEADFLHFQLNEIAELNLEANEQDLLEAELKRLENASEIQSVAGQTANALLEDELAIQNQINTILQQVKNISSYHQDIPSLLNRLSQCAFEIEDIANEFNQIAENTELDPERQSEVQERLDAIYLLQNKHQVISIDQLLELQASLTQRLDSFESLEDNISTLTQTIENQEKNLRLVAHTLSENRRKTAPIFKNKVETMLKKLSMEHARINISIETLEELNATGLDEVAFLFAPNKGSRFEHIKQVASGGELSRLTLCIKSLVASAIPLPTMIFDEIDTGVSGDVALKMGNILQELAAEHQVISITHTPQIASKANKHYFVYKKDTPERTMTQVKSLTEQERITEIATMLSGSPPSSSAMENAKELLEI